MRYHVLKEMLTNYQDENPLREAGIAIAAMEAEYRAAQVTLRNARHLEQQAAGGARVPHVPEVDAGRTVKDRVSFFEQAARAAAKPSRSFASNLKEAEQRVAFLRNQLILKGARLTAGGDIDWGGWQSQNPHGPFLYCFDARSQGMHQVEFSGDGKLYLNTETRSELVDTKNQESVTPRVSGGSLGSGVGIYVMDGRGQFYCAGHDHNTRHSSLLAGQAVAGAGEWRVDRGHLMWISQSSGHYQPTLFNMLQVVHQLDKKHMTRYSLEVIYPGLKYENYASPDEFLQDVGAHNRFDYETMKLLLYSSHLGDETLGTQNWCFRDDLLSDQAVRTVGVYSTIDNRPIKPKVVRGWLKSQGFKPMQEDFAKYNEPLEPLVIRKESNKTSYLT